MKSFAAAIAFLTILPLPQRWLGGMKELENSVPFFPFIGLFIGLAAAGLSLGVTYALPALPGAVLMVLGLAAASGALHLDGLADTADGFLSSRPKEQVLDIMRDSCSGAMGVIALVGILLLKVACFATIPPEQWWKVALIAPVAGRFALVLSLSTLSYAREEGLGSAFYQRAHGTALIVGLITVVAVSWGTLRMQGLRAVGLSALAVLILGMWAKRRIGGATGDTLGAACEIAETVCLLGLCAS